MKKYLCILVGGIVLAGSTLATPFNDLYRGYSLWTDQRKTNYEIYKWAWYHIIKEDWNYYSNEVFYGKNGCKLTIHYCGPGTMMRLSPCKGSRLALPCLQSSGINPREPFSEDIFILRGRLPNGEFFIDHSFSVEWFKRGQRQDPRKMCLGLRDVSKATDGKTEKTGEPMEGNTQ